MNSDIIINLRKTELGYIIKNNIFISNKSKNNLKIKFPKNNIMKNVKNNDLENISINENKESPVIEENKESYNFDEDNNLFDTLKNKSMKGDTKYYLSSAAWFEYDKVNEIEIQSLPEFFEDKTKDHSHYLKIRNKIIDLFNENPKNYLTTNRIRKYMFIDCCEILRIHSFLEHWGIINFNIQNDNFYFENSKNKNFNSNYFNSYFENKDGKLDLLNSNDRSSNYLLNCTKIIRPICNFCGLRTNITYYKEKLTKDLNEFDDDLIILCTKCYDDNKFPILFSKDDFELIEIVDESKENISYFNDNQKQILMDLLKQNKNIEEIYKEFNKKFSKNEILKEIINLPNNYLKDKTILDLPKDKKMKEEINNYNIRNEYLNSLPDSDIEFLDFLNNFNFFLNNNEDIENTEKSLNLLDYMKKRAEEYLKKYDNKINHYFYELIQLQLKKINWKMNHLDEYIKIILHQDIINKIKKNHLLVENYLKE